MPASLILKEVYREHIHHFGEPDESIVFDDRKILQGFPNRVDVFIWDANQECDLTTFATIGMSDAPMPGADHRAELHFTVRRLLDKEFKHKIAIFLANLSMYPFQNNCFLDWRHTIGDVGAIPLFDQAQVAFFHPRFVANGWDIIETSVAKVHILNVVPITKAEKELKSISKILAKINERDIFMPI